MRLCRASISAMPTNHMTSKRVQVQAHKSAHMQKPKSKMSSGVGMCTHKVIHSLILSAEVPPTECNVLNTKILRLVSRRDRQTFRLDKRPVS